MDKDKIQDLIMFYSSKDQKYTTLKEYVTRMIEGQKDIYYACGESVSKALKLPQVEALMDKGYEVLLCCDYVDEFALKTINKYEDKELKNVGDESLDIGSKEEQDALKKNNDEAADMFKIMKEAVPEVKEIKFTNKLTKHPVCLSAAGAISVEMEKAMNTIPNDGNIKAEKILEINENHEIAKKLKELYKTDKEKLKDYAKVLYAESLLIEGLSVENPTEISNLIVDMISKE
jgi:molecular chaperone HtpG